MIQSHVRWPLAILVSYCLIIYPAITEKSHPVIHAHSVDDIRCSHIPPSPDDVTRLELDTDGFAISDDDIDSNPHPTFSPNQRSPNDGDDHKRKARRQLNIPDDLIPHSIWDTWKTIKKTRLSPDDDLIPLKIQVYYDKSVSNLEKKQYNIITGVVMPHVINFFESSLSIRSDLAIDQFRISPRCPNNTVYYARDRTSGLSKSFCMDRCESYAICGEMVVPRHHLTACSYCNATTKRCMVLPGSEGKGVTNAQVMLYVSANQTARCKEDQTIAYAAHCSQDAKTDRPVAGHANLCPSSISTDPKDLRALISTVKHELTHVLGFSVSLFAYFRDEHGRPLTKRESSLGPLPTDPKTGYAKWSDRIIKRYVRSDWLTGQGKVSKVVNLVVTPTVVQEVRAHFNCSTLEGAELEDQGSDGTSMTHWEKRLFENEAMTGTHTQNSVYSRLTLAVLQDTGWYVANFSRADRLDWGRNLGCDFAKKSCRSWIKERREASESIKPYCDDIKTDILQISCFDDRNSKAVCNMKRFREPLPSNYQNFEHLDGVDQHLLGHYGGSVDLADYCPYIQEFSWHTHNVTFRGSRCDFGTNDLEMERNAALEFYGPESKCFEHGRRWEQNSCIYQRKWHHYGAGCYRYTCSDGHLSVLVANQSHSCLYAGQVISVQILVDHWLYNGTIVCPPCDRICTHCKSIDRRVVKEVLSWGLHLLVRSEEDVEKALMNLYDGMLNYGFNSVTTDFLKNSSDVYAQVPISNISYHEFIRHREPIIKMLARDLRRPEQTLRCSNSSASYVLITCHNVVITLTAMILAITNTAKFI